MPVAPRQLPAWLCLIAVLITFDHAQAQLPDNRIINPSGRERAVFPPPRHFEHHHMRLEIDIPDMSRPHFRARQVLRVTPVGSPRDSLILDAAPPPALRVTAVSRGGRALEFEQAAQAQTPQAPRSHGTSGTLTISFPRPVPAGEPIDIVIEYEANFADSRGTGLHWTAGNPDGQSETDRYAQIHSQGQAQYNHTWFPGHDFPNERLTTELIVTVEDPYIVSSNGRLVSTRLASRAANGAPRTTWHWRQDKPHVTYLVSLVIGRFSLVALPPSSPELAPVNVDGRPVPTYLLVPMGTEDSARAAFAPTPEMITFFGKLFDYPYPWDKYSQALVRDFIWSGMENTSATTLREEYAHAAPGEQDDLIVHEVAHQWFGNLVTARSWEHLWLNEGWASYAEALWFEHAAGPDPEAMRQAYQAKIAEFLTAQRTMNRTHAPLFPAMVSRRYFNPEEVFVKPNDVYARGAVVLHMLRQKLGDEVFFEGARTYLRRFAFQQVETDDFRRTMEEVSGLSLEHFFDQWCHRPGLPRLDVALQWSEGSTSAEYTGELVVTVEQVQRVDAANPVYLFTLPLHIRGEDDSTVYNLRIDTRSTRVAIPLGFSPAHIDIDPDMTVAALTRITQPLAATAD